MNTKKKKKYEPDDPEQSARFVEMMERTELVDNPKEAFEQAVQKVVKAKKGINPRQDLQVHSPIEEK
jgi:hypothetical protein